MKIFHTLPEILPSTPLLDKIDNPSNLKKLSRKKLLIVCDEIREFSLYIAHRCGGHLGSGLGVIELTVALHYVFDTPIDNLVWDIGHQAYAHKMLTGRFRHMLNLRKKGGLAAFPAINESEYDSFGAGHSSTSISAAVGMSEANKALGLANKNVAIIGDGALTAGMAFEALNHAGNLHADVLVIFNDNNMSISNNVGALSNYFSQIISGQFYTNLRQRSKRIFKYMPFLLKMVKLTESNMKAMVSPSSLFEALNFNYIGPIDGHNINVLIDTLRKVSKLKGPQFLHISTTKGKGFIPAENNKIAYHAVKKYSQEKTQKSITGSNIFGKWICDKAQEDNKIIGITPAMREGSDLVKFSQDYPQQYFDVGISEQHCLTFAAGLAAAGMKPVVAIYSTFLQRAYDQLIHDICIQNLNVTFAIDRAGLVGEDGPTHAGSFDISFLSCIPNIIIMTPSNHTELYVMLNTAYHHKGPAAVRYPRGACSKQPFYDKNNNDIIAIGAARTIIKTTEQEKKIAILNFGHLLDTAQEVSVKINCTLVDMRFVKPLDKNKIYGIAHTHDYIITIEENSVLGGAGSNVSDYLNNELNISKKILNIGLPDKFIEHQSIEEMRNEVDLDSKGILNRIQNFIAD